MQDDILAHIKLRKSGMSLAKHSTIAVMKGYFATFEPYLSSIDSMVENAKNYVSYYYDICRYCATNNYSEYRSEMDFDLEHLTEFTGEFYQKIKSLEPESEDATEFGGNAAGYMTFLSKMAELASAPKEGKHIDSFEDLYPDFDAKEATSAYRTIMKLSNNNSLCLTKLRVMLGSIIGSHRYDRKYDRKEMDSVAREWNDKLADCLEKLDEVSPLVTKKMSIACGELIEELSADNDFDLEYVSNKLRESESRIDKVRDVLDKELQSIGADEFRDKYLDSYDDRSEYKAARREYADKFVTEHQDITEGMLNIVKDYLAICEDFVHKMTSVGASDQENNFLLRMNALESDFS